MAIEIVTWDLPPEDRKEEYLEKSREWVTTILSYEGAMQFRVFRNPFHTTPQVLAFSEFDTLENLMKFITSADNEAMSEGMKALGCTNFTVEIWDASKVMPDPFKGPET